MAAAIGLRSDYTADDLRGLAKASRDAKQTRRLLAFAAIYDGGTRTEAARIGGVGLQVVRDWVLRFNSGGPAGLIDRKAPGKSALLKERHRAALAQAVEAGPVPWRDGVVRWRLVDLAAWLREEFGITASRQTLGRELRRMGYRSLSARHRRMGRTRRRWRRSKKLPGRRGRDPRSARPWQIHRGVVPRRGAGQPEEPDHPPLGAARHPAPRAARPAHEVGLHIRRDLPKARQGRSPRHALRRH